VAENPYEIYDLQTYYRENISYELTADKRKGLEKFLTYLTAPAVK
jgi:chorismate dehydratase